MMTSTTPLLDGYDKQQVSRLNEISLPERKWSKTSSSESNIIWIDLKESDSPEIEGFRSLDSLISSLEADGEMAAGLADARREVGQLFGRELSLRTLRLRAGLSQASLAQKLGIAQPRISDLEAGRSNPTWESARALRLALGVSAEEFDVAMENTLNQAKS